MGKRKITPTRTRAEVAAALGVIAALLAGSSPSLAAGDAAAGKQTFTTTCGICHSTEPGVSKIGPSLAGIVGSKSGAVPGYNFSPALKGANITWDEQTLDKFLENHPPMFTAQRWSSAFQTPSIGRTSLRILRR